MLTTTTSETDPKITPAQDTIVAISTPPGVSGIGIVRLSGPAAHEILGRIFAPSSPHAPWVSHALRHGYIIDPKRQQRLDEVLVAWMQAPKTYTCEEVVEINCHGGLIPLQETLGLCLREGARLAEPGEFTRRAYLNGRIDLSQAEAVADIICAQTEAALSTALTQLSGGLSREVELLRQEVLDVLAQLEAALDFPDEELELLPQTKHLERLRTLQTSVLGLVQTYLKGRILREGALCVILGRPNVGKSSLLNQLINQDRAIVTPIPGTTRDTIEEAISIGGVPVRLVDTAGITSTGDMVEQAGVRRSISALEQADLILLVLDGSQLMEPDDMALLARLQKDCSDLLLVINKEDLPQHLELDQVREALPAAPEVHISATQGWGIDTLRQEIQKALTKTSLARELPSVLVTNARHHRALEQTKDALISAAWALEQSLSLEFAALDLRQALDHLGEITGESAPDEILERIFSQFCIGK